MSACSVLHFISIIKKCSRLKCKWWVKPLIRVQFWRRRWKPLLAQAPLKLCCPCISPNVRVWSECHSAWALHRVTVPTLIVRILWWSWKSSRAKEKWHRTFIICRVLRKTGHLLTHSITEAESQNTFEVLAVVGMKQKVVFLYIYSFLFFFFFHFLQTGVSYLFSWH